MSAEFDVYGVPGNRIEIRNIGASAARDITVAPVDPNKHPFVRGLGVSSFPIKVLALRETASVAATHTMGLYPFDALVTWTDHYGKPQEQTVTVMYRP